jgi:hypothetical protein
MQIGEFALELDKWVIVASYIASATCACAHSRCDLDHGADHFWMLPHAEIIVRTPDHDILRALRRMPNGAREAAGDSLEIGMTR